MTFSRTSVMECLKSPLRPSTRQRAGPLVVLLPSEKIVTRRDPKSLLGDRTEDLDNLPGLIGQERAVEVASGFGMSAELAKPMI
jgi:hypothetical protein